MNFVEKFFKAIDTNGNGTIELEELMAFNKKIGSPSTDE